MFLNKDIDSKYRLFTASISRYNNVILRITPYYPPVLKLFAVVARNCGPFGLIVAARRRFLLGAVIMVGNKAVNLFPRHMGSISICSYGLTCTFGANFLIEEIALAGVLIGVLRIRRYCS